MLIAVVSVLIDNDVFEPNDHDLKFMVENCNSFCTNLSKSIVTFTAEKSKQVVWSKKIDLDLITQRQESR